MPDQHPAFAPKQRRDGPPCANDTAAARPMPVSAPVISTTDGDMIISLIRSDSE